MYAVEPAEVRRNSERLSIDQILERLERLSGAPTWVVLSGGNPALHELGPLVQLLHGVGQKVAVETQGSVWREWLSEVDRLTISPKPPSSGMATPSHRSQLEEFMGRALVHQLGWVGAQDRLLRRRRSDLGEGDRHLLARHRALSLRRNSGSVA